MVKRTRAHVARLDLSPAQVVVLDGQAHTARVLWNLLHEYATFRQGRFASLKECDAAIREARREIEWMRQLPAQAAQAVLKTYRQAWANFFNSAHPAGRPAFKGRFRARMAVDVPQARDLHITRINRRWGAVNLPKAGRPGAVPVDEGFARRDQRWPCRADHRGPSGQGRARLAHRVPHRDARARARTAHRAEDRPGPGITVPLALSTGERVGHRAWLTHGEGERLLRLERQGARQRAHRTKGSPPSRRERRTYDQIARLRATAKRRALDWQHQTTTTLATRFSAIVVEDLNIASMMASASGTLERPGTNVAQKRGLNRSIAGEAWGRTVDLLTYKSADRGGLVAKVRPHGTSQECHRCHTITPGSRETRSRFVCRNTACGWIGHADTNAARNQLHRYDSAAGRAVTGRGDSPVGGSVKRQASCPAASPAPAPRATA